MLVSKLNSLESNSSSLESASHYHYILIQYHVSIFLKVSTPPITTPFIFRIIYT